jgi:hypothetical protein
MRTSKSKSRVTPGVHGSRRQSGKSVEDISSPRENLDPGVQEIVRPNKTENPPNENLRKRPDEAYGDTEIPRAQRR